MKRFLHSFFIVIYLGVYFETSAQQKIPITESMISSESGNPYSFPENLANEQYLVANTPSQLLSGYCASDCPIPDNGWSTWFADNAILTFPSVTTITQLYLFDGWGAPTFTVQYDSGDGTWITINDFILSGYSEWVSVPIPGSGINATRLRFIKSDATNSVWEIALYGMSTGGCNSNPNIGEISTSTTSATVSWSAVNNANSYDIAWTLNNSLISNENDVSSPFTINGLIPNETYNVCVTSNCSGGITQDCKDFTTQLNNGGPISIDVFPGNFQHPMNSHIIGVNRNAVKADGDATNGLFEDMVSDYKDVEPVFGEHRKLYRLGGSNIDGNVCPAYGVNLDGYFFNDWEGSTGVYPYDDIEFFIQEAEDMDADMIVGVNFGSGNPQLAKDLVNHFKNHPSGNLLDKIAFFEIGNEISGEWQNGHFTKGCDGEQYSNNALPFILKMKEADPDIKIAVPMADTYSFGWNPMGHPNDECVLWTAYDSCTTNPNDWAFNIDKAVEILGEHIDYIVFHGYSPWPLFKPAGSNCINGDYTDVNDMGKRLLATTPYGTNFIETSIRNQLNSSKIAHGVTKDIKFANTEYYTHLSDGNATGEALVHSITEAIFSADGMLNAFKYDYASAINFSFYHCNASNSINPPDVFPCPDFSSNLFFDIAPDGLSYETKPSFKVHELLAGNLGEDVIIDQITNNPIFSYTSCSDINQTITYEKLGLLSTEGADGSLFLLIINRGDTDEIADINPNMTYTSASMKSIYGDEYSDKNPTADANFIDISNLSSVSIKKLSINIIKIENSISEPTCSDGVQNQEETGIDCGGPNCSPCLVECDVFDECPGVTLTVCPGNIQANITDSNVQYVKVIQANWITQGYICASWASPNCTGTHDLDVPPGSYYINIKYNDGSTCGIYNGIQPLTVPEDNPNAIEASNLLPTSQEEIQKIEEDLKIYPNPANNELFIKLNKLAGQKGNLKIVNAYGALFQDIDLENTNTRLLNIDLQEYINGIYFINISIDKNKSFTKKFIVNKF